MALKIVTNNSVGLTSDNLLYLVEVDGGFFSFGWPSTIVAMKNKKVKKSEGIHSFIYGFPKGLLDKSFIVKDGYLYAFNICTRRVLQCIVKLDQIKSYEMNDKCISSLCDRLYRFFYLEMLDGFKLEIAVNDNLCGGGFTDPFKNILNL